MGVRGLILALALATLATNALAAPRLLLEDEGLTVTLERGLYCGHPAEVLVTAQDPELFSGRSERLQAVIDAVRAILGFECRNVPEIAVAGRLAGLEQQSFYGVASPRSDWRVEATRTTRVAPQAGAGTAAPPPPAPPPPADPPPRYSAWSPAPTGDYEVRSLRLGMDPDSARRALERTFTGQTRYDASRRLVRAAEGGCRADSETLRQASEPQAGSACLEGLFTSGQEPRLFAVRYTQVVDGDQSHAIREALAERFGPPDAAEDRSRSGGWYGPAGRRVTRLAWGERLPGAEERELEAVIEARAGVTLLSLQLADPRQGADDGPRFRPQF